MTKRKLLTRSLAGASALSLFLMAGCNGQEEEDTESPEEVTNNGEEEEQQAGEESNELEQIEVMLDWYPNAVHSYLYAAQEQGYFAEEGVEVDLIFPANPTDPLNLAATGEVTLGITYQPDVITARNEGIPVISVAAIVRSPLNHIVYLEDSGIESPSDLEGRQVGYPGIPVNEPLIETMVTEDGGNIEEVELIDVGFELGSSIVTERADAVIGAYINHEVPVLEHQGHEVGYFDPVDYGVPAFYELVMVTNEDNFDENEDVIHRFWEAASRGYEYMKENPDESLDILFGHEDQENFPLVREVEEQSLDILLSLMEEEGEPFGSQTEESWEETIEWLVETGYIDEQPSTEDIFVNIAEEE
ncbi:ABC transporter substrate-binding protein [Bacillus sp. FJAT-44742]|uniref:ABC transporter substrate-binding protein n=1 Tax=Bacillus sp. FJAT-44742 TaxID=2014005 RepID=UPI001E41F6B4|nr:ABC transporter substrate-binding protein [Bacillus sp. FJAT-44742]